jgi:fucose 4-O-acetylase-like acetyltransferase
MRNNIATGSKEAEPVALDGVKHRVFYLDALKALAIILVIIGHLPAYCYFGWVDNPSLLGPIVSIFHMPLFMMISGYFTNVDKLILARKERILIPFLAFGLLYVLFTGSSIGSFLSSEPKAGYWYLYVLAIYYLFIFLIRKTKINLYLGLFAAQLLFLTLHFYFHRTITGTTLSTDHMWQLWPAFCVGILLHRGWGNKLQVHPILTLGICLTGTISIEGLLYHTGWNGLKETLLTVLVALCISIALFLVFFLTERACTGKEFFLKPAIRWTGTVIGQNTLQIYVLHYFLITYLDLHSLGAVIRVYPLLEFLISPVLAIIIAFACVGISWFLHRLHLGFLFGR